MHKRVIYKYEISALPRAEFTLMLPMGANIVKTGVQHGKVMMWAEVNPELALEKRRFKFVGTGSRAICNDPNGQIDVHIETFFEDGGMFVWHMYECFTGDRG